MSVSSIQEYLASLTENEKKKVEEFIAFMKSEYPNIQPKISFSMPVWLMGTKMKEGYVAISTAKKYFTIHFSDEERVIRIKEQNPGCKTGKRCINIPYDDTELYKIIKKNVKEHIGI